MFNITPIERIPTHHETKMLFPIPFTPLMYGNNQHMAKIDTSLPMLCKDLKKFFKKSFVPCIINEL